MNRFDIALNRLPISEVSALLDGYGEVAHAETERILVLGDGVREKINLDEILEPVDNPTEQIVLTTERKEEEKVECELNDVLLDYMMDDAERTLQPGSAIKYLNFIHDKIESSTVYKFERIKERRPNFFFNFWEEFQCKGLKTRAHALYLNNIMNYRDLNSIVSKNSKAKFLSPGIILNWASNLDKVFRIVASCDKRSFLDHYRGHYRGQSFDALNQPVPVNTEDDWDGPVAEANYRVIPDRVVFG